MPKAGGSARTEYQRRRAREKARIRDNFLLVILLLLIAGPGLYFFARAAIPGVLTALASTENATATHQLSLLLAVAGFLGTAGTIFGQRRTTTAFRIGAAGEEHVARALEKLDGYRHLHDLPLRGSFGNIDHVVVGPAGVFTVETKNAAGKVTIRRGELRENGRRRDHIAQASRQVAAVKTALARDPELADVPVRGFVCYARAEISVPFFGSNVIDGVEVVNRRPLRRAIMRAPQDVLDEARMARVEAALRAAFVHEPAKAALPRCECGSTMVLRHRNSDRKPFYGCARFPVCRQTVAAT